MKKIIHDFLLWGFICIGSLKGICGDQYQIKHNEKALFISKNGGQPLYKITAEGFFLLDGENNWKLHPRSAVHEMDDGKTGAMNDFPYSLQLMKIRNKEVFVLGFDSALNAPFFSCSRRLVLFDPSGIAPEMDSQGRALEDGEQILFIERNLQLKLGKNSYKWEEGCDNRLDITLNVIDEMAPTKEGGRRHQGSRLQVIPPIFHRAPNKPVVTSTVQRHCSKGTIEQQIKDHMEKGLRQKNPNVSAVTFADKHLRVSDDRKTFTFWGTFLEQAFVDGVLTMLQNVPFKYENANVQEFLANPVR